MQHHDWDSRYASSERLFSTEPDGTLAELAQDLAPGRALDLGAGEGRNSLWLARRGWDVTAVDQSGVALGRLAAEARRQELAVTTVVADMNEYLAAAGQFDLVVLANLHPTPKERATMLAAAADSLSPGGHLFVVGHHVDSLGIAGPPDPRRLYTEELLAQALPGLELLRLERRDGRHGDTGKRSVDVVAWATRPADEEGHR
jgi:SAM-dependent methyltransferase